MGQRFPQGGGVIAVGDRELYRLHHDRLHASAMVQLLLFGVAVQALVLAVILPGFVQIPWASSWHRRGRKCRPSWWISCIPVCHTRPSNKPETRPAEWQRATKTFRWDIKCLQLQVSNCSAISPNPILRTVYRCYGARNGGIPPEMARVAPIDADPLAIIGARISVSRMSKLNPRLAEDQRAGIGVRPAFRRAGPLRSRFPHHRRQPGRGKALRHVRRRDAGQALPGDLPVLASASPDCGVLVGLNQRRPAPNCTVRLHTGNGMERLVVMRTNQMFDDDGQTHGRGRHHQGHHRGGRAPEARGHRRIRPACAK